MNQPHEQFVEVYQQGPVWCERNLIRNPLTLLSRTDFDELLKQSIDTGTFLVYEYTNPDRQELFRWKVYPSLEYGYPGPFDKDVLITIQKLVTDTGSPPPNPFPLPPLRRICEMMGKSQGKNVAQIATSLKRWATTSIETNSFYLRQEKQYWKPIKGVKGSVFNLWSMHWMGEKLPNGTIAEAMCLFFNPPFYQSLRAFYTQPLDYEYYMNLRSPLAKRIYELQAPKFFGRKDSPYIREEYEDYCHRLPIVVQRYYSDARRILGRAHHELLKSKFFSKVEWEGTSYKKPWIIHYYPGARAQAEIVEAKGRAGKLVAMQRREQPKQLALIANENEVQIWVEEIYHKLEAYNAHEPVRTVNNSRFYKSLAAAIVRDKLNEHRVRELLSETYQLWHEGKIKKSRSAYFTDLLKRYLAEKGKNLKQLLREA